MTGAILFAYPGACSRVTMSALEETGTAYDLRWIDLGGNAQYDAGYLATNRKAKVPALVMNGETLTENAAILFYLHQQNPSAGLLPAMNGQFGDAQGLSDLAWCAGMLHPMVRQVRAPGKWTQDSQGTDGIRADGIKKLGKECAYINERLSASDWWYGAAWSIIDVYLYWVTSTAAKGGFVVDDYPAIVAHSARVRERATFRVALDKEIAASEAEGLGLDPASL